MVSAGHGVSNKAATGDAVDPGRPYVAHFGSRILDFRLEEGQGLAFLVPNPQSKIKPDIRQQATCVCRDYRYPPLGANRLPSVNHPLLGS
jgi:hypothetical protein